MGLGIDNYLRITVDDAQRMSNSRLQGTHNNASIYVTAKHIPERNVEKLKQVIVLLDEEIKRRNLKE